MCDEIIIQYTFEEFKESYKEAYEQEKAFYENLKHPICEFDLIAETTDNLEEYNFYTYFIGDNTVIEITKEGDKYSYEDFFNENESNNDNQEKLFISPSSKDVSLSEKVDNALCFVLMPFDEKFDGIYDLIKEDLDNFNLNIKRADDIHGPGIVIKSIFDNIQKSKFLIADLTDCNANVFYELGYAAALNKKVILITQDELKNMPFDVLGWRTISYSDSIKGFKHLKKELNSYIENL